MRIVLQRVTEACVKVDGQPIGQIEQGLLVFLGIAKTDTEATVRKMVDKLLKYRVFIDPDDKMNMSLRDIEGGLLLVSQFTLQAETQKGLRPGFSQAAAPDMAEPLYQYAITYAKSTYAEKRVQQGMFGADMKIALVNDGPVTFILDVN